MAAFASRTAAEQFARDKMADNTFVVAHVTQTNTGTIAVRCLRKVDPSRADGGGNWFFATDDTDT